jgi:hypothetical protein
VSAEEPSDVVRLREAFASLANEKPEEPEETVDAGRIFDALYGEMSPDERQAVVDELLVNPAAAQAWRLAREIPPDVAPKRSTAPVSWKWMSIAASVVLALGLGWQFVAPRDAVEPPYRSTETRAIQSALPRDAVLARTEPVLRWTGVDGARYRVRVLTTELAVLEESAESPARDYTLSEDTLRRIPPGSRILWQVEGRVPGEAVIVSPTFTIIVP